MAATTSIGTLIGASTATPTAENASGYAALTYTAIGEVTEVPEYGIEYETITHVPLATGVTDKLHGAINYGSMDLPFATDSDGGQTILRNAANNRTTLSFRVTFPSGTVNYFRARVMAFRVSASSGSVVNGMARVELVRPIVEV